MSVEKHFTAQEAKEIGEELESIGQNSMSSSSGWGWMSNWNMVC